MARKTPANPYDITSLTMREIAQIEKLSGQGLGALENEDKPKGLVLAAIAYTFKLRDDKAYTWNNAQDLTLAEIAQITEALGALSADEDEEPDEAPEVAEA